MESKPIAFLAAAAIAATIAAGCSKGSDQSSSSSSTTTSSSAPATTGAMAASSGAPGGATGDAAHGKQIFAANCASCHGATGTEGGVGPSLKGEKSRKNYQQAIAWIKNPQPPMPKLYPSPLSEKDVDDVAAFVETL
jgi:mono/diheme cytochrome c family protein